MMKIPTTLASGAYAQVSTSSPHASSSRHSTDDDSDLSHASLLEKGGPDTAPPSPRLSFLRRYWHWLVHLLLLILWAVTFAHTLALKADFCGTDTAHSPVKSIIRHSTTLFAGDLDATTPYKGPPTPELDKHWNRLMSLGMVRITPSDLHALGRDSYALHDGSGHLGFVDVFHQLHCLNMVRMCLYSGSGLYGCPDTSGSYHTNHCIDILRQAIMCHADTNIVTWDWEPGRDKPVANGTVEHTCRNFEEVFDWTMERRVTFKEIRESVRRHSEDMGVEIIGEGEGEEGEIAKRDWGFEDY